MKQTGIIMQPESVLGILAKRKTLTSRLRGLEKINAWPGDNWRYDGLNIHGDHLFIDMAGLVSCHDPQECVVVVKCPYGQPGDILIGRETWMPHRSRPGHYFYRASLNVPSGKIDKWRSPRAMPWKASRLRLQVVKVWPSRLHDMTESMAIAEGCSAIDPKTWGPSVRALVELVRDKSAVGQYSHLWNSINAKRGHPWHANEWVWRIHFQLLCQ